MYFTIIKQVVGILQSQENILHFSHKYFYYSSYYVLLPCLQISKSYLVDVHRHLLMNFSNAFCGFQFQARVYYYSTSIGWHFLKCNFSPSIFTIENRIIWERIQHRSGSGMKKKSLSSFKWVESHFTLFNIFDLNLLRLLLLVIMVFRSRRNSIFRPSQIL